MRPVGIARLEILENAREHDRLATMAADVRAGLGSGARSIPPKYFYDDEGCRLFDAICDLDEYYLTRAERALLESHAQAIIASIGPPDATALVEIGTPVWQRIVEVAGERDASLIVLGSHRRSGLTGHLLGSVAAAVVKHSASSVLVVH